MAIQRTQAGRVQSINDEGPEIGKVGKVQKAKIKEMVKEHAGNPVAALSAVDTYCRGMNRVQARAIFDNEENPENIVVLTAGSQLYFSLQRISPTA
jgi:hypothetical protein